MSATVAPPPAPTAPARPDEESIAPVVVAEAATDVVLDAAEEDTELASEEETKDELVPPPIDEAEVIRTQILTRIEASPLPPGVRSRLAELVSAGSSAGADGRAVVAVEDALRAVEEALPDVLRLGADRASRPAHPSGEAFFSGSELSDERAEAIARGQLERSGLLRGQRVRVAD